MALLATAGTTRTLVADVTARAQGSGVINYAIFLTGSGTGVTLQQVTALAENGTSSNHGLFNFLGAAATLRGGSFTGRGGADAYGISNNGSGTTLEAEGVIALAENGTDSHGLHNEAGATATLRGGSFTARGGADDQWHRQRGQRYDARGRKRHRAGRERQQRPTTACTTTTARRRRCAAAPSPGAGEQHQWGIVNADSGTTLEAESVTALGENGSFSNHGLYNS